MSELDDLAKVEDTEAEALIAEADADFADLALDAAAELEQDLELEVAIADVATEAAADADQINAEVSEGGAQVAAPEAAEAVAPVEIGRRRVGKECLRLCRSRWSPYH